MNMPLVSVVPAGPDYPAIKARQQSIWASGDYSVIGTSLQLVGERLVEAVDLRAGERVLDVAAGNGNASLAAARHFADVTSTDYVESLLVRGKERADAERLPIRFQLADVETLPYPDGTFDAVLSTFGAMFAPDQERVALEMLRVVSKEGRIGMANWTPDGFIGQLFRVIGKHVPPPAGLRSPALWGSEERLVELFPNHDIRATRRILNFRYRSAAHWIEVFRTYYGPVHRAFAALDAKGQVALGADIMALLQAMNRSGDATLVVPSSYLEVVIRKR